MLQVHVYRKQLIVCNRGGLRKLLMIAKKQFAFSETKVSIRKLVNGIVVFIYKLSPISSYTTRVCGVFVENAKSDHEYRCVETPRNTTKFYSDLFHHANIQAT